MADKEDEKVEKVEDDKEQPLTVITDETPPEKKADDEDGEGTETEEAGEGAEDERLGGSDDEIVDQERERSREERRGQRRSRNKVRREWGDRMVRENRFLSMRNDQLERQALENARRLDALEGSTIDGRINQFRAAIAKADDTIADAITRRDGEAHKEASRIRDGLRDGLAKLEDQKEQQTKRSEGGDEPPKMDPVVLERTREWAGQHKWFGQDEDDTSIVKTVDDRLQAEGVYDPRTEQYWEELDKRLAKYLPHRYKQKARNGRTENMNDDDDDQEQLETRGGEKPNGRDRDTRNGRDREERSERRGGGPRFRSGGAERQLGPNEVYLSKDRIQAMRDAGFEEGSKEWNSMLKRYKQFDTDPENSRAR